MTSCVQFKVSYQSTIIWCRYSDQHLGKWNGYRVVSRRTPNVKRIPWGEFQWACQVLCTIFQRYWRRPSFGARSLSKLLNENAALKHRSRGTPIQFVTALKHCFFICSKPSRKVTYVTDKSERTLSFIEDFLTVGKVHSQFMLQH